MHAVSFFQTARDNQPVGRSLSEEAMGRMLSTWRPAKSKDRLPAWSPARYAEGQTRAKSNVLDVSCLVFDVDDGMPFEAARECFGALGLSVLAHTSWSHGPDTPKWRLVLPLMRPVPAMEWPRAWRWALSWWVKHAGDEWMPDTRCSDASRIFYLPALREGQESRGAWAVTSWLLDVPWWEVPAEAPKPKLVEPSVRFVGGHRLESEIRRKLATDPGARKALGRALGGAVGGDLVRNVRCPKCNRKDVWWPIYPDKRRTAECNHRNSCGWFGRLEDLAAALGMRAA